MPDKNSAKSYQREMMLHLEQQLGYQSITWYAPKIILVGRKLPACMWINKFKIHSVIYPVRQKKLGEILS